MNDIPITELELTISLKEALSYYLTYLSHSQKLKEARLPHRGKGVETTNDLLTQFNYESRVTATETCLRYAGRLARRVRRWESGIEERIDKVGVVVDVRNMRVFLDVVPGDPFLEPLVDPFDGRWIGNPSGAGPCPKGEVVEKHQNRNLTNGKRDTKEPREAYPVIANESAKRSKSRRKQAALTSNSQLPLSPLISPPRIKDPSSSKAPSENLTPPPSSDTDYETCTSQPLTSRRKSKSNQLFKSARGPKDSHPTRYELDKALDEISKSHTQWETNLKARKRAEDQERKIREDREKRERQMRREREDVRRRIDDAGSVAEKVKTVRFGRESSLPAWIRETQIPKPEMMDCVACMEAFIKKNTIILDCTHAYCRGCIKGAFETALKSATLFKCCGITIPTTNLTRHLSPQLIQNYTLLVLELSTPDPTYCSRPTCSTFIPPLTIHGPIAICPTPSCESRTCISCKSPEHAGVCEQDRDGLAVKELARRKRWKECPSCKQILERTEGCLHMTCRCRAEWCYACLREWRVCESRCGRSEALEADLVAANLLNIRRRRHPELNFI